MSSREKILAAIKQNKPSEVVMPSMSFVTKEYQNVTAMYMDTLAGIGGKAIIVANMSEVQQQLQNMAAPNDEIVVGIETFSGYNIEAYRHKNAQEVEGVDRVVLEGKLAVAENGSVWLPEKAMVNRLLPFICQHLVFVINEQAIVANMHDAYAKINAADDGYGVFIAGPSKTADIEQSLVIGAHGPLSLIIFIISNS